MGLKRSKLSVFATGLACFLVLGTTLFGCDDDDGNATGKPQSPKLPGSNMTQAELNAIWAEAPKTTDALTSNDTESKTSLADAGLKDMALPPASDFKSMSDPAIKTEVDSFFGSLDAAAQGDFGFEDSSSRRLAANAPVEITKEPTAKLATIGELPFEPPLFEKKGTRVIMWQKKDGKKKKWCYCIQGTLKVGEQMNKMGMSGASSWLDDFTSRAGSTAFVVSEPFKINGFLVRKGITMFASIQMASGPVKFVFDALSPFLKIDSASSTALAARTKIDTLTKTKKPKGIPNFNYPSDAQLMRLTLPSSKTAENKQKAAATVEFPSFQFDMPMGVSLDFYRLAIRIKGLNTAPNMSMGGSYIMLFDETNTDNGFYGKISGKAKPGETCILKGTLDQFGDLPWPLGNSLAVKTFRAQYVFPLVGNRSNSTPAEPAPDGYVTLPGKGMCTDSADKFANQYDKKGFTSQQCAAECTKEKACVAYSISGGDTCHQIVPSAKKSPSGWTFMTGNGATEVAKTKPSTLSAWVSSTCNKKQAGAKTTEEVPISDKTFKAMGTIQIGDVKGNGWKVDVDGFLMYEWRANGTTALGTTAYTKYIAAVANVAQFNPGEAFCWMAGLTSVCPDSLGVTFPASLQPTFNYAHPARMQVTDLDGEKHVLPKGFSFQTRFKVGDLSGIPGQLFENLGLADSLAALNILQPAPDSSRRLRRLTSTDAENALVSDPEDLLPGYALNGPGIDINVLPTSGIFERVKLVFISSACPEGGEDQPVSTNKKRTSMCQDAVRSIAFSGIFKMPSTPKFSLTFALAKKMTNFNSLGAFVLTGELLEPWTNAFGITNLHIYKAGMQIDVRGKADFSIMGYMSVQFSQRLMLNCTLIIGRSSGDLAVMASPGMMIEVKVPDFTLVDVVEFVSGLNGDPNATWLPSGVKPILQGIGGAIDLRMSKGIEHNGVYYPPGGHAKINMTVMGFNAWTDIRLYADMGCSLQAEASAALQVPDGTNGPVNTNFQVQPSCSAHVEAKLDMGLTNLDLGQLFSNVLDFAAKIPDLVSSTLTGGVDALITTLASKVSFSGLTKEARRRRQNLVKLCKTVKSGSLLAGSWANNPVPNGDWSLCSPNADIGNMLDPIKNGFTGITNAIKNAIPANSFKVNELSIKGFSLESVIKGGRTKFLLDVDIVGGFNKKIEFAIDWAFLQPFFTGVGDIANAIIPRMRKIIEGLTSDMIKWGSSQACNLINNLCIDLDRGKLVDFTIDYPTLMNSYVDDLRVRVPSSNLGKFCMKTYVAALRTGCRRLDDHEEDMANLDDMKAEVCYRNVRNGFEPSEIRSSEELAKKNWVRVPVPDLNNGSNSTHTTHCFHVPTEHLEELHRRMDDGAADDEVVV